MIMLWKIWQTENADYDTYDSAIVAAETAEDATKIHPSGHAEAWNHKYPSWASSPSSVFAACVGRAAHDVQGGSVLVASFNAG